MVDYKLPIITGTSLTIGDLLRWDGSDWVNYADSNYAGGSDEKVKIDVGAAAGYLGAAAGDGVLRAGNSLSYTDGGDYITLDTIQDICTSATPTFAGLTITNAITEFSTDGTLGGDSDSALPTEKAVKTYVDAKGYVDRGDPDAWDFILKNETGSATSTSANHLVDTAATFQTNGVVIGQHVHNTTDDTWATITAVNSETDLTLDADIMVNGEAYYVGTFRTDGNWYDLDCSGIVPAGAKAIHFGLYISDDEVGSYFLTQKNGNVNNFNKSIVRTQVANAGLDAEFIVACNANRKVEYMSVNREFVAIDVVVRGWFI